MARKSKQTLKGTCKLTGQTGKFVKSHLLPKALTKADGVEPYLVQAGRGQEKKRFSSWYDRKLVTEVGEKILEEYDNWAIRELRKQKLVWSGWGPIRSLTDTKFFMGSKWGTRTLKGTDWERLRLFFLSLLWRAAATNLDEFSEISIPNEELEQLRKMVVDRNPKPLEFFPLSLTQLSTMGVNHNHTPLAGLKVIPGSFTGEEDWEVPIYRFYLDGLIIHFSRLSVEENRKRYLKSLYVGSAEELVVTTLPYEGSFQEQNLAVVQMESAIGKPLPDMIVKLMNERAEQHISSIFKS